MTDPVQIAQATALEIPVTVQGSKIVEGTEQRTLFTESTKTTLVSDKGAVLKLNAKVLPGQCLFLRNDQSGREILCKVLESRQAGETGCTDLQFTVYDPNFWDEAPQKPASPVAQTPPAQKEPEGVMSSSEPAPAHNFGVQASADTRASLLDPAPTSPAGPPRETIVPAHEMVNSAPASAPKDELADWDESKDAELIAVLAKMGGDSQTLRDSTKKATKEKKELAQDAAAATTPDQSQSSSSTASEETILPMPATGIRSFRYFIARQNPIHVGIVAALLVAIAVGFAWRSSHRSSPPDNVRPSALSALPAQPAQKIQPPTETQKPGVPPAQMAAATTKDAGAARSSKAIKDSSSSAGANVAANRSSLYPGQPALANGSHRKPKDKNADSTIPPQIVAQSQPPMPRWAKGLDLDTAVQLDALIDEKGNLVDSKALSGPRFLQATAQRAVGLWLFAPATQDGKPVAAHILLTVQFQ